jgi:hypothetical protein
MRLPVVGQPGDIDDMPPLSCTALSELARPVTTAAMVLLAEASKHPAAGNGLPDSVKRNSRVLLAPNPVIPGRLPVKVL